MSIYKVYKVICFRKLGLWRICGGYQINGSSLRGNLANGPIPIACKWPGPAVHRQILVCLGKTTINGTNQDGM